MVFATYRTNKLKKDLLILSFSILLTLVLVKSGLLDDFSILMGSWGLLGVFLAGLGFSSIFTVAVSTAIIFIFAQYMPFWLVAFVAAAGSMLGDYLIFRFLRQGIAEDFSMLVQHYTLSLRWSHIFKSRLFYWFSSFVAALIIASPLPDEMGLTILSVLRFNTKAFLPIAFALNFLGILTITLLAQVD